MIEVRGIDMNGEPQFLAEESRSAADLASSILNAGWKDAMLTWRGRAVAEVTLRSRGGRPPVRYVKITDERTQQAAT